MGREMTYCLRQRLLRWDWDIKRSVLSTRGWAAQERMLAPRILHFTKRQLIWECLEGFKFEASGIQEKKIGRGQTDLDFNKSKLQPYITRAFDPPINLGINEAKPKDILKRVRVWQQCVDEYSKRHLTIPSDKFPAISGIAAIINHDGKMGQYLAGLWSNHVAAGLAWGRQNNILAHPPSYRAPSWSWASVDGWTSSLILSSRSQLLETPNNDTGKLWADKFDIALVDHNINMHDKSNPYGIVLEGSYITIEGTYVTRDEFLHLAEDLSKIEFDGPTIGLDRSDVFTCPCCKPSGPDDAEAFSDEENLDLLERLRESSKGDAHFDLCLFLFADVWHNTKGFVDLLHLRWTDENKGVAVRVGMSRTTIWEHQGSRESFCETFLAADWKRRAVKLV
ncbi:uncharacterized protein CTRU02_209150 [Colletotrichum truncatum]|uniref:Uncharacterized protein n=1 Tax=Colletotrichum truncatum TaxID=5467 RepID=A0ACC3YYB4_COLTU|nr:uncharacterized protein CTRU02_14542 [Colletotrichum truncatum]KAF6782098.1 hypothetical protein CTRU02_14542 [Colletotrichum truncatum]